MITLDRNRPFATSYGPDAPGIYSQDGYYFNVDGEIVDFPRLEGYADAEDSDAELTVDETPPVVDGEIPPVVDGEVPPVVDGEVPPVVDETPAAKKNKTTAIRAEDVI